MTDAGLVDVDTAVFWNELLFQDASKVVLQSVIDFSPDGLNRNQRAIGKYLNDIQVAGSSPTSEPIAAPLFYLPDVGSLAGACDSLSPQTYAQARIGSVLSSMEFGDAMLSCRAREGQFCFVDEDECGWYPGFAMSFEDVALDTGRLASSDGTRAQAGFVIKGRLGANTLSAGISGGHGSFDAQRRIELPSPGVDARADYGQLFYAGTLRWPHVLEMKNWYVQPSLDLAWTHLYVDAFREKGAGAAGIHVRSSVDDYTSVSPMLEVGGEMETAGATLVRPFVRLGVDYFMSGLDPRVSATFDGAPAGYDARRPVPIRTTSDMQNPRFTGVFLALLLAVVSLAAPAAEPATDILPFAATTRTLPNGLVVIVVPTGFPNIVSLQIPVLTGSRNEVEPGKSGFAHFFEHMMFRGTPTLSPDAYNAIITKAGARQNAYTTDDYTNYHVTFAKEDLETVLRIEADRFQNLSYPVEAFKTEARAVLGEYNKNSANPIMKLYETMRAQAFSTHTYRHTTMGFIEDIEDMPNQYEYSKTFFSRWYRPGNAALIVAGDVDPARVLPLVEKYWGGWAPGTAEQVAIPQEPAPKGAVYAHVPWQAPTAPWITIAFRGPAFSETAKDAAAIDLFMNVNFGQTSDVYRKLVEQEQKVDQFFISSPDNVDPELIVVFARVKQPDEVLYVRDEILRAAARARATKLDARRLEEAKSNLRYSFSARLDNTDTIAGTLARFVRYSRSYDTLNNVFRVYAALTPEDIDAAAKKYFVDEGLVVTTLAKEKLPDAMAVLPTLASFTPAAAGLDAKRFLVQRTELPQLSIKALFDVGSAYDPPGKEGLARLAASIIAEAGSRELRIDEINKALYPIAGALAAQVDKEMTTFTMSVHRDNWPLFASVALPQLLEPGFRQEDFDRLKTNQLNALTIDLRSNNEEELGKEWLQNRIFAGTPYGHAVLGTVDGLRSITLEDVKAFIRQHYVTGNLKVGVNGGVTDAVLASLAAGLGRLPAGETPRITGVAGQAPLGYDVDIIAKDTRATAISFGHPIEVTRASADFAALDVARAWLGEHRASMSHLYDRIREKRGMNYGDYAYIEAFPRGMYQFAPDPNIARQRQLFEVWIRPVVPEHGHMALRIALYEVDQLVRNGLTKQQFEATRDYLMKNVYVKTATANQQVGYALDSQWYGIGDYAAHMRAAFARLTVAEVNRAIRRHIRPRDMKIVMITKDAEGLKQALVADQPSRIEYGAEKPRELLEEDAVIGALQLGISAEAVHVVPVDDVFRK